MSDGDGDGGGHGHHHRHGGHQANFGNPEDLDRYLARLDAPDRADWQRPDDLIRALRLRPGDVVAEVGSGSGYFTLRLARAVGPQGKVYAVEVAPEILAVLRQRLQAAQVGNVEPLLAPDDDPLLPAGSCAAILVVNTFHHFPDGAAYLRKLAAALQPGGRLVNVDFHDRETPVGPPLEQRVSRQQFLAAARAAGLEVLEELELLPHQYVLVLQPRG